jgi:hypothetical protein
MRKLLGTLCAAVLVTTIFAGAAGAAVVVTPNPIEVSPAQNNVTVPVAFAAPPVNQATFVSQCKKDPADPTFSAILDCSNLSGIIINPNPTVLTLQFDVFRGQEQSGDELWGCFAQGDTVPAGIVPFYTCWIRVAYNAVANNGNDEFTPFTFNVTAGVVPEAPIAILLPLFGALVIGGGVFLQRRRHQTALTV